MIAERQWGEWLPSAPDWKNPGCIKAENVIPTPGGYGPAKGLRAVGDTITGAVRGAQTFYSIGGQPLVVGGTATSLFSIVSGTATTTASLTDIGAGQVWDFCQFNDVLIAVGPNNNPKYLDDIDTDTSWGDLTGSPPRALYCARVNNFVMFGNISTQPNRLQWSSVNNPTGAWAANRLTQAGFRDAPRSLGAVQRVVGGRYGLVFQERGVSRLDYVGPPQVFRLSEFETGRGAIAPFSVVTVGFLTFFLSQDGFYVTNGSGVEPVGSNRVNRWFFDAVAQDEIGRTHAAVDWQNECIVWAFQSTDANRFDRAIVYSWGQNRWTYWRVNVGWLVGTKVSGLTVDALGAIYSTLADVPGSTVDDAAWRAKSDVLAAMVDGTTTTQLNYFDGSPLAAELESGQFQPMEGRRVFASQLRPIMAGDTATVSMALVSADNLSGEQYGAYTVPGVAGFCPVRADGRAMRVAQKLPAGLLWSDAQGYQIKFRPSGAR